MSLLLQSKKSNRSSTPPSVFATIFQFVAHIGQAAGAAVSTEVCVHDFYGVEYSCSRCLMQVRRETEEPLNLTRTRYLCLACWLIVGKTGGSVIPGNCKGRFPSDFGRFALPAVLSCCLACRLHHSMYDRRPTILLKMMLVEKRQRTPQVLL